jgi:hypothetical protein
MAGRYVMLQDHFSKIIYKPLPDAPGSILLQVNVMKDQDYQICSLSLILKKAPAFLIL